MTEQNSPEYQLGLTDGEADAKAYGACPPGPVIGPNPPANESPHVTNIMYMRGYHAAYGQRRRCGCAGHGRHSAAY